MEGVQFIFVLVRICAFDLRIEVVEDPIEDLSHRRLHFKAQTEVLEMLLRGRGALQRFCVILLGVKLKISIEIFPLPTDSRSVGVESTLDRFALDEWSLVKNIVVAEGASSGLFVYINFHLVVLTGISCRTLALSML